MSLSIGQGRYVLFCDGRQIICPLCAKPIDTLDQIQYAYPNPYKMIAELDSLILRCSGCGAIINVPDRMSNGFDMINMSVISQNINRNEDPTIDELMKIPYTITIQPMTTELYGMKGYVAYIKDLGKYSCNGWGKTMVKALEMMQERKYTILMNCIKEKLPIPLPTKEENASEHDNLSE